MRSTRSSTRLMRLSSPAASITRSMSRSWISPASSPSAFASALDSWIDGAVERLLDPILAINCLLNPSAILIGGRLPLQCLKVLEERLNASLARHAAHLPGVAPIERAELAEDAPTVGAAILPLSHYLLPKAATLWKQEADVEPEIESTGTWMQRA